MNVKQLLLFMWMLWASFAAKAEAVYTDSLQNGWVSYGWATLNFSSGTPPAHGGTKCINVTPTQAYQAMFLHHDAFDSSLFTNLTFWINPGSSASQKLQVQAQLTGQSQTVVKITNLVANTWVPVTISLKDLGVANKPDFDGFWIQDVSGTTGPAFYVDDISLTTAPPPAQVNVTVDAAQVLRQIDSRMFGLNAAAWDSAFDTTTTVDFLKELDMRVMRFPGGSLSDEYHWQSNTTLSNTWQWATSFDKFLHVVTNSSTQPIITVNYGTGTPEEASNWVTYANSTRKAGIEYWEIGNEVYGNWETDTNVNAHDPFTYASRAKSYMQAMRAADPTIKIGVVVELGEDNYSNGYTSHPAVNPRTGVTHNGWTPVVLATLKQIGVLPDFLIYHKYAQNPGNENDAVLLQSSSSWGSNAADLRRQLGDYLGTSGATIELFCTENNSVSSKPGKQTTSLVNALFMADSFGQATATEFKIVVWWDLRNGQDTANNNSDALFGWRPLGDYGIVSGSNEKYPTYFGAKLLQYFARDKDKIIKATSDYPLLSVYGALRTNGSLSVMVINKSPSNALTVNLRLFGYTPYAKLTSYSFGMNQDNPRSAGAKAPDLVKTTMTNGAATLTQTFEPYSLTLFSFFPAPPVLKSGSLELRSGVLTASSPVDQTLILQSSFDLISWTNVMRFSLSGGSAQVQDVEPIDSRKFYRTAWEASQ